MIKKGSFAVATLLVALAVVLGGCTAPTSDGSPSTDNPPGTEVDEPDVGTTEGAAAGADVLMMGRSVMGGWFEHWGREWDGPITREGHTLEYAQVDTPPTIVDTAIERIQGAPDGTIVFFKLCFADFWADDPGTVDTVLATNAGYVQAVVAAARERGLVIVLGNALPQTEQNTARYLVELHGRYNEALEDIADGREGVYVFDLYGALTDGGTSLAPGMAVSTNDAHLTDAAYDRLDEEFFPFLESVERGEE